MRLRALIMIEFLDNNWSHQINSIKMIYRQIKMCEWSELVLYRKTNYMTSFVYNSSRMIIILKTVLSLIHDFRILSIMNNHISWQIFIIINAHDEKRTQNLEVMKWLTFILTLYQLRRRDLSYTSVRITVNIRDLSSWTTSTASTRFELCECTNYN
jgi:hypothetical protein